jgi:hypothetical protein
MQMALLARSPVCFQGRLTHKCRHAADEERRKESTGGRPEKKRKGETRTVRETSRDGMIHREKGREGGMQQQARGTRAAFGVAGAECSACEERINSDKQKRIAHRRKGISFNVTCR